MVFSNTPTKEEITIIVSDGLAETSETMLIEVYDEKPEYSTPAEFLLSNLWMIILLIILITSLTGYGAYRRYVRNYKIEEVFWLNKERKLIFHESFIPKKTKQKMGQKLDNNIYDDKLLQKILELTEGSFKLEKSSKYKIKEFKMDEKKVSVCGGNQSFLVTVFTGSSGEKLYSENRTLLRSMEFKYNSKLAE
jgi:hypothetical protein